MAKKPIARRVNDAQVERLLYALKSDLKFRQQVARRIADRDKIEYKSAMRRLQRYVTDAGEKRSFARAPKEYQREVRQETRILRPEITRGPVEPQVPGRAPLYPPGTEFTEDIDTNYLRAIIAYHDGDLGEAADALNLTQREERLLGLANRGVDVQHGTGAAGSTLAAKANEFLNDIGVSDRDEIIAFHDFLMDRPEWIVNMVLQDMAKGHTSFADWIDMYMNSNYEDIELDPEYWRLFRQAYKRAGKLAVSA